MATVKERFVNAGRAPASVWCRRNSSCKCGSIPGQAMMEALMLFAHDSLLPLSGGSATIMRAYRSRLGSATSLANFEGKATGYAFCYTGRLQSVIKTIFAVITFNHFMRGRVPLRSTPRTGCHTALASDAET